VLPRGTEENPEYVTRHSVQPVYVSRFEAGMSDSTARGLVALSALDMDLVRFLPLNEAAFYWCETKNDGV
jgi:hypothetical protein